MGFEKVVDQLTGTGLTIFVALIIYSANWLRQWISKPSISLKLIINGFNGPYNKFYNVDATIIFKNISKYAVVDFELSHIHKNQHYVIDKIDLPLEMINIQKTSSTVPYKISITLPFYKTNFQSLNEVTNSVNRENLKIDCTYFNENGKKFNETVFGNFIEGKKSDFFTF